MLNADIVTKSIYSPKQHRILIPYWGGKAYEKHCSTDYDTFYFEFWQKTGYLMTANGNNDEKIKPEGLNDYQVPPFMSLLDPANAEPSSNDITPAQDEPDDVDSNNEGMVPTDDTCELDNKAEDWEYNNPSVGHCVRGLNEDESFDDVLVYYKKLIAEYVIHYSDWLREFLKDQDF